MRATLTDSPAYQLTANLTPNQYGYQLRFESFVATARRPEVQRRFAANLSTTELLQLRWLIDDVLTACGVKQLDRPAERTVPSRPPHSCSMSGYFHALARQRRLQALKSLAEDKAGLSLQDVAALTDVLRLSLQRLADQGSKQATLGNGAEMLGLNVPGRPQSAEECN